MKSPSVSAEVDQTLQLATSLLARGGLTEGERVLRQLLLSHPACPDGLNMLSSIANQSGRPAEAVTLAESAVSLKPMRAEFHFVLGRALKSMKRLEEAVAAYERALQLQPRYPEALVSLGIALRLLGRLDDAAARQREALRLRPDYPEALTNLGNVLVERLSREVGGHLTAEDLREAEQVQRRALSLSPEKPEMLHNLGLVLKLSFRHDEAMKLFDRALAIDGTRVDSCLQFAHLLSMESRFDLCKGLLLRWIGDNPPHPDAMLALGQCLLELGDVEGASQWLEKAAALAPDAPKVQHLRGRVAEQRFDVDCSASEALADFRTAINARPDFAEAVYSYLMLLCYVEQDPVALEAEHRARMAPLRRTPDGAAVRPRIVQDGTRRLRLGYVSSDFKRHSVAYFIEGLLEAHDRTRFEVFAYKGNAGGDEVTARMKSLCDHWVECGSMSDAQLRQRILADGIDVLVDLSGLTYGGRTGMFLLRAAPCQIGYLGYPTRSGASCFDFWLTDPTIAPDDGFAQVEEPALRIAPSMFCYRPGPAPEVGRLPALQCGRVSFGSFNNLSKATPHTLALWSAVLRAVPGSRLVLKAKQLMQHGNRHFIERHFESQDIDPTRIELLTWEPDLQSHLGLYHGVDVALDTFPYNGATTSCEALYMGVPVVSRSGRTHPSRMGASILGAAGLPELVAHDDAQFVDIACRLAGDLDALSDLRGGLRERMRVSALCDTEAHARRFEAAIEQAFAKVVARGR